jgi:hypothetical protein
MAPGLSAAIEKLRSILTRNDSAFDTAIADNTANRIDASGAYEYNIGRHFLLENGTFIYDLAELTDPDTFADRSGKFQVTAKPGDEHVFGARELVRYVPNYELLFGAAAWAESTLESGQHFAIEFADDTFTDGYRYHYYYDDTAGRVALDLEQSADGVVVDTVPTDLPNRERHGYDHTKPGVARGYINWYGAGLFRGQLSYPTRSTTLPYNVLDDGAYIREQDNPTLGKTANDDDVATGNPNLRVQVRTWAESDAANPVTVNVCSLGALIRGNATEFDREKPSIHWNVGGSISQYPTDNVTDAIAARIDPTRNNVSVKMQPPLFQPDGSGVTLELSLYAVHKGHPDLTVNFDDPDDDGTDEGPSPTAQSRAQTDVMQYTRDVTSIPTTTDIRADATEGLVPDMRQLTSTVGQAAGGNAPGSTSGGEVAGTKRNVYKDDVVIFLPRSDPESNVTSGVIQWLKPLTEQDW